MCLKYKRRGVCTHLLSLLSTSRFGIRCNCVLPGFISTPMTDKVPEKVISKVRHTHGFTHLRRRHLSSPVKRHDSSVDYWLCSVSCCCVSDSVLGASGKNGWACRSVSRWTYTSWEKMFTDGRMTLTSPHFDFEKKRRDADCVCLTPCLPLVSFCCPLAVVLQRSLMFVPF